MRRCRSGWRARGRGRGTCMHGCWRRGRDPPGGVWSRTESSAAAGQRARRAGLRDLRQAARPPRRRRDRGTAGRNRTSRVRTAPGKALLLEKPLALDVAGAERIAEAVEDAHVGSVMVLTYRYAPRVREFLAGNAAMFGANGGRVFPLRRSPVGRSPSPSGGSGYGAPLLGRRSPHPGSRRCRPRSDRRHAWTRRRPGLDRAACWPTMRAAR